MSSLLRQRALGLLFSAGLISSLGDSLLIVALPFAVYHLTGSVLATGAMFLVQALPRVLLGSLAGVLVDRWDRRWTMIGADLGRALVLLLLLLVRSPDWLWVVYLVAALEAAGGQLFNPAQQALVPRLVAREQLPAANSLLELSRTLTGIAGPPLGGALALTIGLPGIVILDSLSFILSALLLVALVVPAAPTPERSPTATQPAAGRASLWSAWRAGLALAGRDSLVATILAVVSMTAVGQGIVSVLVVPFVIQVLGGDTLTFGLMGAGQSVGMIAGSLLIGRLGQWLAPARLFSVGGIGGGLGLLATFHAPTVAVALLGVAVAGLPIIGFMVSMRVIVQERVADAYRGRIFGLLASANALFSITGMGLASLATDRLGVLPMLDIACGLLVAGGLVAGGRLWATVAPSPAALPPRRPG